MARSTASASSGERASDGCAALELLHVDARVVAALDRGHHGAGARRVEERERRRLLPAGVLVGVVADDRRVRDRAVDAPVDPRQPRGDLVDGPVEVVDPALQRDREVDDVGGRTAEDRLLTAPQDTDTPPGVERREQCERRDRGRRDRNRKLEAHEPTRRRVSGEGVWGNREVPPHEVRRRGLAGETGLPPRERAAGERLTTAGA